MIGMFAPLFTIDDRDRDTFNLFDLGRLGAPLVPVLFAGAVVLAVLGIAPDRAIPNLLLEKGRARPKLFGHSLLALALAETIAVVLDISIGFAVVVNIYNPLRSSSTALRSVILSPGPAEIQPGLLLLVLGPVLVLSGATDRWHSGSTSEV
ncbi:hypothetical protein NS506_02875 [Nocardia seriolae]|uniref:Uncharacterized protein n=3 Tax=Nocardia seriolae TaxID=37332 RepID=A0ABC9YPK5_9NOCA|nr:hypothetical protein NS506_02875 [Nocardia seriolae]GEM22830.1 hypothetical protein NS2_10690 [Nocardia seriolae NBRC 15557]OJF81964.1 hypothetical protein NS14008_25845 [Nocardia seriolae]PSK32369.1 hypothetical protein C6575_05465 [Nocardia seriolae]RLP32747.1 hypothetical protein D6158_06220 [Nocardia seriolae]